MRKSWALLPVALLVLGFALWPKGENRAADHALNPNVPEETQDAEIAPPAVLSTTAKELSATQELPSRLALVEPPVGEPEEPVAEKAPVEKPTRTVRGTIKVVELDGSETMDANGVFDLYSWSANSGNSEEIAYVNGQFEATLDASEPAQFFELYHLTCDGSPLAILSPNGRFEIVEEFDVVAKVPEPSTLRVVDAANGADLSDVLLVHSQASYRDDLLHPGIEFSERLMATDLVSPIDLSPFAKELGREVLVGAPGYSWELARVNFLRGGEQRVALALAGSISVDTTGVESTAAANLRIRRAGLFSPVAEETLRQDGTLNFTGLKPGNYQVSAEIGTPYDSPVVLARSDLSLSFGENARVSLDLSPAPTLQHAALSGWVHIAKEWKLARAQVLFELLDTPLGGFKKRQSMMLESSSEEREGYDSFRFKRSKMQVGRYELGLSKPPQSIVIDLPEGGLENCELIVPPPVEVYVRFYEKESGTPVTDATLHWHPKRPEGVTGGSLESAVFDQEHGANYFQAPEGELLVSNWSGIYQFHSSTIDVGPGRQDFRIELDLAAGFTLKLEHEGLTVPFPQNWRPKVKAESGEGRRTSSTFGEEYYTIRLSEPGFYTVELPEVPGFRELPAQRIDVLPNTIEKHVVQLERL